MPFYEYICDGCGKAFSLFMSYADYDTAVVTCPSCGERAPLLNAFALQKKKDGWMVIPQKEGQTGNKKVRFVPVRLRNGKGPNGEDPEIGTVSRGTGRCIFCGGSSSQRRNGSCCCCTAGVWYRRRRCGHRQRRMEQDRR